MDNMRTHELRPQGKKKRLKKRLKIVDESDLEKNK